MTANLVHYQRTKHIKIDIHFVHEKFDSPKDLFHSPQPSKEALGYIYRCRQGLTWLAKHNIGGKIEISNTKLLDFILDPHSGAVFIEQQNRTFILDPDSRAVFLEQSHLLVFFHDLRDEGLAAPRLVVGLTTPRSVASPAAPWLGVLLSKVACPATVVAHVATVVIAPLKSGLLGTSSCIALNATTRLGRPAWLHLPTLASV
jgi:hypothetical protein